jgi:hypothetical protein
MAEMPPIVVVAP